MKRIVIGLLASLTIILLALLVNRSMSRVTKHEGKLNDFSIERSKLLGYGAEDISCSSHKEIDNVKQISWCTSIIDDDRKIEAIKKLKSFISNGTHTIFVKNREVKVDKYCMKEGGISYCYYAWPTSSTDKRIATMTSTRVQLLGSGE